jgi:diguanylate cyclase (GGDEF)-like protein/PAS domain S-box-containing protein
MVRETERTPQAQPPPAVEPEAGPRVRHPRHSLKLMVAVVAAVSMATHLVTKLLESAVPALRESLAVSLLVELGILLALTVPVMLLFRPAIRRIVNWFAAERELKDSELRFETLFARSGVGVTMVGLDGRFLRANEIFQAMTGYAEKELRGLRYTDVIHAEDLARHDRYYQDFMSGRIDRFTLEKRYVSKTGKTIWTRMHATMHRDTAGRPQFAICIIEDVTERRKAEQHLRQTAKVIENTLEGVVVTAVDGRIQFVNPAFSAITGYTADEAIGQTPRILKSDHHTPEFYRSLWHQLAATGRWEGEIWNRRKNGEVYPEWLTISSITDEQGQIVQYVSVFHDISEQKQREALITHQAFHDALTGLPNRVLFGDRLSLALAHSQRVAQPVAVMFVDIDRFKVINDTLGHLVGDRLLQEMARRLQRCVRGEDTVARMGGDEFTVILQEVDEPGVKRVAGRILEEVAAPVHIDGHEIQTSASIGISIAPDDGQCAETLMKHADIALYKAKDAGRNQFFFFGSSRNGRYVSDLNLERDLRRAVEREEFVLHYQPRVDVATGRIGSAEVLLRWQHPERGLIGPNDFIPLAEETRLILPISEWVLRAACAQAVAWRAEGLPALRLAVNICACHFHKPGLPEQLAALLQQTGLPAEGLELEITETVAMRDLDASLGLLQDLERQGIHLTLDDFGTGYSSLGSLSRFPVKSLKLPRAFLENVEWDLDRARILRLVIVLAHTLGVRVIAEGVETISQMDLLRDYRCDEVQGYLFSRALPADEFREAFLEHPDRLVAWPVVPLLPDSAGNTPPVA